MFPTVFAGGGSASSATDGVQPADRDNKMKSLRKQLEEENLMFEIAQTQAKRQEIERKHGLSGSAQGAAEARGGVGKRCRLEDVPAAPACAPAAARAPAAGGFTAEQHIRLKNAEAVLLKEQNEKERLRQMQERGSVTAAPVPMAHEGAYPEGASSGKRGPQAETDSSAPESSGKTARGIAKSSDLALAKRMRGYMLNLRKSLDLSVKAEPGTAACAFKRCANTYSGSTVFVPAVQKELRSRYPEYAVFADEFFKSFPKSGRTVLVFKELEKLESSG